MCNPYFSSVKKLFVSSPVPSVHPSHPSSQGVDEGVQHGHHHGVKHRDHLVPLQDIGRVGPGINEEDGAIVEGEAGSTGGEGFVLLLSRACFSGRRPGWRHRMWRWAQRWCQSGGKLHKWWMTRWLHTAKGCRQPCSSHRPLQPAGNTQWPCRPHESRPVQHTPARRWLSFMQSNLSVF